MDTVAELVELADDTCVAVCVVECDTVRVVVAVVVALAETDDVAVLETVVDPDCETLDVAVPESVDVAVDDNDAD